MQPERRIRRSEHKSQALSYQLEAATWRGRLDFMVLASDEGLLVADSSPDRGEAELVAARLACLNLDSHSVGEIWCEDRTVTGYAFEVGGQRMILGAVGPISERASGQVTQAIQAVGRIMS